MNIMQRLLQQLLWFLKAAIFIYVWWNLFDWMPAFGKLFMIIWYFGLFFHSTLFHRYAAHKSYYMSPFMEKVMYVGAWLFQGPSYLSAPTYGILHRLHHKYTDTEKDPHSPRYDDNPIKMMKRTYDLYNEIHDKRTYMGKPIDEDVLHDLPYWRSFDRFAGGWISRLTWAIIYIVLYLYLAIEVDHATGFTWIFVVLFMFISFIMGPFHGVIINWWGHIWGYRNHEREDDSRNIGMYGLSVVMNALMIGEDIHNNHHDEPSSPNFAQKPWEFDAIHLGLWGMSVFRLIRLR